MMRCAALAVLMMLAAPLAGEDRGYPREQAAEREPYAGTHYPRLYSSAVDGTVVATPIYHLPSDGSGYPGVFDNTSLGIDGFTYDCSVASSTTEPRGAAQAGTWHVPVVSGTPWITTGQFVREMKWGSHLIVDLLWVNEISLNTNALQTISMPSLPPRDIYSSSDGHGVVMAYWHCLEGNAGIGAYNYTIAYTDSDGNPQTYAGCLGSGTPCFQREPRNGFELLALAPGVRGVRSIDSFHQAVGSPPGARNCLALARILAVVSQEPSGPLVRDVPNLHREYDRRAFPIPIQNGACVHFVNNAGGNISSDNTGNIMEQGFITVIER